MFFIIFMINIDQKSTSLCSIEDERAEQRRLEVAALLDQSNAAQEDGASIRQLVQRSRELAQELEHLRRQGEAISCRKLVFFLGVSRIRKLYPSLEFFKKKFRANSR